MNSTKLKLVSATVGVTAAFAMGALGVAFSTVSSAGATTGETITTTTPPSTPETTEATPSIEGPAPLPTEEQGLPG